MFTKREIPANTKKYILTSNGGNFCMVNLGGNDESLYKEIENIDDHNKIFIRDRKVNIYFPAWDYFYRDEFHSENEEGFTLKEIIKLISDVGYYACGESWIRDKSIFTEGTTYLEAASSVGEFALWKFDYENNNIYVDVDH